MSVNPVADGVVVIVASVTKPPVGLVLDPWMMPPTINAAAPLAGITTTRSTTGIATHCATGDELDETELTDTEDALAELDATTALLDTEPLDAEEVSCPGASVPAQALRTNELSMTQYLLLIHSCLVNFRPNIAKTPHPIFPRGASALGAENS